MKRFERVRFLSALFLLGCGLPLFPAGLAADTIITFQANMGRKGEVVGSMANNINIWNYATEWLDRAETENPNYFREHLPFVTYVQLMTAAGGSESRDLFLDPLNRRVLDDYNFGPLVRACRNIERQGLIPHLKLGNVPLKLSDSPLISKAFGVNVRPPGDMQEWHRYIFAMAKTLVDTFGIEVVRLWRFGVFTEYENKDRLSVDDSPEATRDAYFALYDYTVDALEKVVGKEVCVGAHSMTVADGLWDEREFITHCARGKNLCTGKRGTRLTFLAASFYDFKPGVSAKVSLAQTIQHLRERAEK